MFHVFIIGSAGFDPCENIPGSKGQLPTVENILQFMKYKHNKQCYLYFIDPRHLEVKSDLKFMEEYQKANIPCCFILRPFKFETFYQDYKIDNDDGALFIDFANFATSEYDFINHLEGQKSKKDWYYYTPGCSGPQLNLIEAYEKAKNIPHYTLFNDKPVPRTLSKAYKADILKELNSLLQYVRYIPATSKDARPPEWFLEKIGRDETTWTMLRESAYSVLSNWFERNCMMSYNCYPSEQWYKLVNDIIQPTD
jgi:hypothetical protein